MNRIDPADIIGKQFDKLVVISYDGYSRKKNGTIVHSYTCKCDCGNFVSRSRQYLIIDNDSIITKSCGCVQKDHIKNLADKIRGVPVTHGLSNTKLYKIWHQINNRCYNKSNIRYNRYGERGITVCDEWNRNISKSDGFMNFYNWAYANGYYDQPKGTPRSEILSIERIDNNGPYAPWNCKWITNREQVFNRECSWRVELLGETYSVSQICYMMGVSPHKYTYCWKGKYGERVWNDCAIIVHILHPEYGLHLDRNRVLRDKDGFIRIFNKYEVKDELQKLLTR